MNPLQILLGLLTKTRGQSAPGMFERLNRGKTPQPRGVDPNLAMLISSQNGMRNRRDTAGNYIMPGSNSYFSGPSGIDAYKEMQKGNTGSSIPGFNSGLTSTERLMNERQKAIGQRVNPVTTFNPDEKFETVGRQPAVTKPAVTKPTVSAVRAPVSAVIGSSPVKAPVRPQQTPVPILKTPEVYPTPDELKRRMDTLYPTPAPQVGLGGVKSPEELNRLLQSLDFSGLRGSEPAPLPLGLGGAAEVSPALFPGFLDPEELTNEERLYEQLKRFRGPFQARQDAYNAAFSAR